MTRLTTLLALYLCASAAPAADLLAVYQRALQNDPQLREAEATRLAALEAKPQALSALLPQLSGTGIVTREKDTGSTNTTEPVSSNTAGAQLTLVDVREDWETTLAPVPADHLHILMDQIEDRLGELNPAQETVVICRSGGRSLEVARFLSGHGFAAVYNLTGGILAWSRDLDPRIPQY